jgi:ABC-2 type transport system ATP-binding protein
MKQDRQTGGADGAIALETKDLSKRYGPNLAVDQLTLRVRCGEVYGFLGPNGAGKTTTMRMALGLVRPSAGMVQVLGRPAGDARGLRLTGAVIENPAFYPYLSGRDNLLVVARHAGRDARQVDAALERVDLRGRARDRFAIYSVGMKQRLGLAAALVKDAQLLVLDEPTSGLDPVGVAALRTLLRELAGEGRAIFLSSHQLGEVEQTCDRAGVIVRGRLVLEGSLAELRGRAALVVVATPLDDAASRLAHRFGQERVRVEAGAIVLDVDPAEAPAVNAFLVSADIAVGEVRRSERRLEDVFIALSQTQANAATSTAAREGVS